ncbi:aldehyde dehydrogenase family protein [Actinomadura livida]|uniref:Acyl-CoA reductase-like NAD-dependent aldehyde dehydrogenase n=1 Tax=Actinomadura livida TaxID=79909 RepID=A0A7W7IFM4_9ACTN|nr:MULTISPECIES: aldehyde dehydrogenase family protein [Actinomadura]MBB4776095.1 acyl-CoA reductase-like NAD-dependent aldehyde dehydrogenase [Actinomadura catellatispora]GGU15534.1 aldehyde dehydrogenase [Actinomadura livida]
MSEVPAHRLYIDGAWTDGTGDAWTEVVNPATEEVIGRVPEATQEDAERAVRAARRAFDEGPWPSMPVQDRAAVMLRMAELLERRAPELIDLNIAEVGSIRMLAEMLQVGVPLAHFRDMAERIMPGFAWERPLPPTPVPGLGLGQGVMRREPCGVAALIPAYNFPLFLSVMKLAPALAAGCTTVLKPAPAAPLEVLALAEVAEEAGLPPGVLNIVTGGVEAGRVLTTDPRVDLVSFTGSDTVGRQVYAQAAEGVKKVVLELGGKSPSVICEDADLDKALGEMLAGIATNAGQGCSLFTRTLVHRSRHDELVEKAVAALGFITVGDPADPATAMGPLISRAQRDKVEKLVRAGEEEGARIVHGGRRPAGLDRGFFFEPTLFTGVDNTMTIARTEFFGPVGCVIPFEDDDEAVRLANDNPYGLAGSVWAADPLRAYGIAGRVRAGMVMVNGGGGGVTPHVAFGGYKQSGLGREWGEHGLDEYLQTKSITWSAASG